MSRSEPATLCRIVAVFIKYLGQHTPCTKGSGQERVLGKSHILLCIRSRKPDRKARPANAVSEQEISVLLQGIKQFDGYPKLKELRKMAPSLSPLQINVIVRYLERSGAIVVDNEGYIVWARKEREQLTLGEVAEISGDLRKYLEKQSE